MSEPTRQPRRRILVVANETCPAPELREVLLSRGGGSAPEVLLVCPALASRFAFFTSDLRGALAAARARLEASLVGLGEVGVVAEGRIGDADPLLAIEDALREFAADEVIISTHPPERSNWLERKVVDRARSRFPQPVTHVIVSNGHLVGDRSLPTAA